MPTRPTLPRRARQVLAAVVALTALYALAGCGWQAETQTSREVLAKTFSTTPMPVGWSQVAQVNGGDGMDSQPRLNTLYTTKQAPEQAAKAVAVSLTDAGYVVETTKQDGGGVFGKGYQVTATSAAHRTRARIDISATEVWEDDFYVGPRNQTIRRTATAPRGGAAVLFSLERCTPGSTSNC